MKRVTAILFLHLFWSQLAYSSFPKTISGEELHSSKIYSWDMQKAKKGTVVFFLSSSCPCSNSHISHLKKLKSEFRNLHFIGIHSNKFAKRKRIQDYFNKKEVNFPVLLDHDLKIANLFKAVKTPHVFVFNQKGKTLFHGGLTNSINFKIAQKFYLKEALTDIENGLIPKQSFARALGCYISR